MDVQHEWICALKGAAAQTASVMQPLNWNQHTACPYVCVRVLQLVVVPVYSATIWDIGIFR